MRVKLTAKHPRSASSERAPVRSGSTTARKPARPHGPRPATPRTAEREAAPAGAGKRPGATSGTGRGAAGGGRPARTEGSFSRDRDAGGGASKRAPSDRPPRREGAPVAPRRAEGEHAPRRFEGERGERAPRRAEGERSERPPRRFEGERSERAPRRTEGERSERPPRRTEGERSERPPRRAEGERGERAPARFEGERGERAPRRFEGERSERPPRRTEGERSERPARRVEGDRAPRREDAERDRSERPPRFARDEGARRPSFGGARGSDDTRRPGAPRTGRPSDSGTRGERPARRERDESRDRSASERPRFGQDRGANPERRPVDRPARDEGALRAPADSRDPRPDSKDRGSFERRERTFAKPVKTGYGERPDRAPREDRDGRPAARREFGDRPPRGDHPAGTRTPRASDSPTGSRFAERDRAGKPPRSASSVARPPRSEEAAPRAFKPQREHDDAPGTLRLSKLMSELGLCSRREADEWIENGWVRVDGEKIDTLGTKVRPDQRVEIDPAAQAIQARLVTVLLHKPVGFVSGQAEDGYQPAVTLFTPENRWEGDNSDIRFSVSHLRQLAPAGRLDIDSTGLLVLTQDGRVAKRLIGGHSEVEKEYLVRVNYGEMTTDIDQHFPPESIALLRHGLSLDDQPLKPAKVSWQNGEQLRFVLREGKKRQIRRMCELVGLEVVGLKRVRMGSVPLGALPPGQWRYLSHDESF